MGSIAFQHPANPSAPRWSCSLLIPRISQKLPQPACAVSDGQATAAAKAGDKGSAYQGAVAVSPGVWIYQVTDKGLALELTAKGTKYFKDSDLN